MPENINFVQSYLKTVLYPEDQYPREKYNCLDKILISYFLGIINKDKNYKKIYQSSDIDKLKELLEKTLSFRKIMQKNPYLVVVMHEGFITRFIYKNQWRNGNQDDIKQEVILRLLNTKIHKICKQYKKKFKKNENFLSFFMLSLRNTYIETLRSHNMNVLNHKELEIQETDSFTANDFESGISMDEEFNRFETILKLYHKSAGRIEISLKLKHRLQIDSNIVHKVFTNINARELNAITKDFRLKKDQYVFNRVKSLFIRNGYKINNIDSFRRWINRKEHELIKKLNVFHDQPVYNRSVFSKFIAAYYNQFVLTNEQAQTKKEEP